MNEYAILITAAISVAYLICFFVLCANVAKLVKLARAKESDMNEYLILKKMGENEKAYYHLKRSLAKDLIAEVGQPIIDGYIKSFESLGLGIPEMINLNNENK